MEPKKKASKETRLNIRIEKRLRRQLERLAKKQNRTVSDYARLVLHDHIEAA